eukprot:2909185-Amphidinium_carterae.3
MSSPTTQQRLEQPRLQQGCEDCRGVLQECLHRLYINNDFTAKTNADKCKKRTKKVHRLYRTNERLNKHKGKNKKIQRDVRQQLPTKTRERKHRKRNKRKGKGTIIYCYLCGRPTHTSDTCWWRGPTYNIDQSTSIWSLPSDTIWTKCNCTKPVTTKDGQQCKRKPDNRSQVH